MYALVHKFEAKDNDALRETPWMWTHCLLQAKELWAVGEKQRQKQWQEKKIKDLKETAIRGLEPHLDNLNEVLLNKDLLYSRSVFLIFPPPLFVKCCRICELKFGKGSCVLRIRCTWFFSSVLYSPQSGQWCRLCSGQCLMTAFVNILNVFRMFQNLKFRKSLVNDANSDFSTFCVL